MASVESCKDDEAFARSLQALYDEDDNESENALVENRSDTEPEEFIPEECWPKNKKRRAKGSRDINKRTNSQRRLQTENKIEIENKIEGENKHRQEDVGKNLPCIEQSKQSEDLKVSDESSDDPKSARDDTKSNNIDSNNNTTHKNLSYRSTVLYTEEEEKLFLEGLNLYGRDWCKIAKHVGTRDRASITSHAQKYFIHLWIRGEELPPNVAKGGLGYSLSGKSLDPDSSSVRPYVKAYRNRVKRGEVERAPQVEALLEKSKCWSSFDKDSVVRNNNIESDSPILKAKKKIPKNKTPHISIPLIRSTPSSENKTPVGADGKTDYSRNRPKRGAIVKGPKRQYLERGYELMKCSKFGSGQPFCLIVHRITVAIIDLHSHILDTEIVGVLAGRFDHDKNECIIQTAIPCDRKETDSDNRISVEATEESLAEAACIAQNLGISIMGWYHSHPIFSTDPSHIDVKTQHEHQVAFNGYISKEPINDPNNPQPYTGYVDANSKPFIGAICGPYNIKLPTNQSEFNWFIVANPSRRQPYKLKAELVNGEIDLNNRIPKHEAEKIISIAGLCKLEKYKSECHDFNNIWRKNVSYKSKIISSFSSWLKIGNDQPDDNPSSSSDVDEENSTIDYANCDYANYADGPIPTINHSEPVKTCVDSFETVTSSDTFISLNDLISRISAELDSFNLDPTGVQQPLHPSESCTPCLHPSGHQPFTEHKLQLVPTDASMPLISDCKHILNHTQNLPTHNSKN